MVKKQRRAASELLDKAREAAERLVGALDEALRGRAVEPALVPVRRPTAEELRRHARRRRGY
ncbi:MAG: hypothetical protein M3Q65_09470 [Chloroflexota bacterium]|nr:hypothetical protein [Chloroflexota bacterium]